MHDLPQCLVTGAAVEHVRDTANAMEMNRHLRDVAGAAPEGRHVLPVPDRHRPKDLALPYGASALHLPLPAVPSQTPLMARSGLRSRAVLRTGSVKPRKRSNGFAEMPERV